MADEKAEERERLKRLYQADNDSLELFKIYISLNEKDRRLVVNYARSLGQLRENRER